MEWTEEIIVRLRSLWSEGHSTAEIGRRLGVSKNAVVGKAHRLTLAPRPSPIRRGVGDSTPRVASRRVSGPTLPPLPINIVPMVAEPGCREPAASVTSRVTTPARPGLRVSACCWPIGEPGTRSFRFCDRDSLHAKPYCRKHAQLAYVKIRDRRDEVA